MLVRDPRQLDDDDDDDLVVLFMFRVNYINPEHKLNISNQHKNRQRKKKHRFNNKPLCHSTFLAKLSCLVCLLYHVYFTYITKGFSWVRFNFYYVVEDL